MSNLIRVISIIGFFLLGILFTIILLFFLTKLPLSRNINRNNKLYSIFGIRKPQIIGFQPFWLLKRADKDYTNKITTLTYFGLTIDTDGTIVKLVNPREEEPGWTNFKNERVRERLEKAKKNNLKLSLVVRNSNEASIASLLEQPEKHAQNLINDVTPLIQKNGFTDLNLDIESFKEASPSTQQQFTDFVQEVKSGMETNDLGTLTVEITPSSLIKSRLTNAKAIGKIADYVVLMTYDFHYLRSFLAGPVAPIGGVGETREYDVETALKEVLNIIPREKVILGIPLYGYEWETIDKTPGAATIPGGGATASNRRVTELFASCDNCIKTYDENSLQPYVIFPKGDYYHQIYYEDKDSLQEKLSLAKEYKIAGVALWALGYEGDTILNPLEIYKNSVEFNPSLGIVN